MTMDRISNLEEARRLRCVVMLDQERDAERAARACGVSPAEMAAHIDALATRFGCAILLPGGACEGFTAKGQHILAWARRSLAEWDELQRALDDMKHRRTEPAVMPLLARRSVSPKRLQAPGPDLGDIDLIVQAALRAPDHGGLHPWRILEFREEQRLALANCFEEEKRRRDPLASAVDLRRARAHATLAPVLLAFIVSPRARTKVPVREQWLAAGAALGNLLNAAHQLGFGAIVLSGERCFDPVFAARLGLRGEEYLAGFVSLGSVAEAPPAKRHALPGQVWSCWLPSAGAQEAVAPAGQPPVPTAADEGSAVDES